MRRIQEECEVRARDFGIGKLESGIVGDVVSSMSAADMSTLSTLSLGVEVRGPDPHVTHHYIASGRKSSSHAPASAARV